MPDLERIQQSTPGTLSQQWYEDGAAVDPGTVTVGITRADGTVLVAAGTATTGTGTAARTYNLTTTHTALLDRLTVTWTSTLKGTLVSYVEVVGGFLFSIAEARGMAGLGAKNNDGTYKISTADIMKVRTQVEEALEGEVGYSFVPRYHQETFSGESGLALWSRLPLVGNVPTTNIPFETTLRTATIDGTAVSSLTDVIPDVTGFYYASGWSSGRQNVTVTYDHGAAMVPARANREALILANRWGSGRPADERATSVSTEDQTTTFYLPGSSEPFDVPSVNRFVQAFSLWVGVA